MRIKIVQIYSYPEAAYTTLRFEDSDIPIKRETFAWLWENFSGVYSDTYIVIMLLAPGFGHSPICNPSGPEFF